MMAIRTIAVLVGLLAFSTTSIAGDAVRRGAPKGITDAFYGCMDQAAGDIVGLGGCTMVEKKVQDARLNKAYSALMAKLDATGQRHLRAAERAWIEFNAKSVDAELDVRNSEKTANIDASINEVYRYAARANTLETLLSVDSD